MAVMSRALAAPLAAAAMLAFAPAAPAQDQDTGADTGAAAGEAAGDGAAPLWLIACSNQASPDVLMCEFSQSIVVTAKGGQSQRVATASFRRAAGAEATEAVFTLPLEVALTGPVRLTVDGAALGEAAWQSCDAQGCEASAPAGADWLATLRGGKELGASVAARGGRGITFTFQLRDFTRTEALMP